MAFNILEDPSANIFRQLPPEVFKTIREGMIRCILATDMARHNEILNQFKEIPPGGFDPENRAHVNLASFVHRSPSSSLFILVILVGAN